MDQEEKELLKTLNSNLDFLGRQIQALREVAEKMIPQDKREEKGDEEKQSA